MDKFTSGEDRDFLTANGARSADGGHHWELLVLRLSRVELVDARVWAIPVHLTDSNISDRDVKFPLCTKSWVLPAAASKEEKISAGDIIIVESVFTNSGVLVQRCVHPAPVEVGIWIWSVLLLLFSILSSDQSL